MTPGPDLSPAIGRFPYRLALAGGWIEDGTVACPWHAWRFSLVDGCWLDNPKIKADIFSVHIVDDQIQIEIDDAK